MKGSFRVASLESLAPRLAEGDLTVLICCKSWITPEAFG